MKVNAHHFNINWSELFLCVPYRSTRSSRTFRSIYGYGDHFLRLLGIAILSIRSELNNLKARKIDQSERVIHLRRMHLLFLAKPPFLILEWLFCAGLKVYIFDSCSWQKHCRCGMLIVTCLAIPWRDEFRKILNDEQRLTTTSKTVANEGTIVTEYLAYLGVLLGDRPSKYSRVQGIGMTDKLSHSAQSPHLWALDTQASPRDLIPTKYRKIGSSCSWRRTVTAVHVTLVITLVCFVGISNCQSFLVQIKSKFGAGQDGLTVFSPRYRWHWSKSKEIIFIRIIVIMHLSMLSPRVGGRATHGKLTRRAFPWVVILTFGFRPGVRNLT